MSSLVSSAAPSDYTAAAVLRQFWGITAVPEHVSAGVSRDNWRIGEAFWLSYSEASERARFLREAELLRALPFRLKSLGAAWTVPEIVPTMENESIATSEQGFWRITRHVPGQEPDPRHSGTYPALAAMLAEVHKALGSLPQSLVVCERGIVEKGRDLVHTYCTSSFSCVTQDPRERFLVQTLCEWLGLRLSILEAEPRQLTHGDWIPRNLKVSADGWAVLDWEFCRLDPVVMDLAQSCCTLLMWSGLNRVADRIDELVHRYAELTGHEVSMESVPTAMVLYWLNNYDHWRGRQARIGRYGHVLAIQPERLHQVGTFVGAL
jgi:Ser/Thr protein kinase RdoA (MazF antagonist)